MPSVALRRRTIEQVNALVQKDFDRYRGKTVLVHYAVDHRRLGHVNVNFVPPLLARVNATGMIAEWDPTNSFCDVSYEITPLDLHHADLAAMDWLHINAPGRSVNPAMDEFWLNHWSLAKHKYGVCGPWIRVPRKEDVLFP